MMYRDVWFLYLNVWTLHRRRDDIYKEYTRSVITNILCGKYTVVQKV